MLYCSFFHSGLIGFLLDLCFDFGELSGGFHDLDSDGSLLLRCVVKPCTVQVPGILVWINIVRKILSWQLACIYSGYNSSSNSVASIDKLALIELQRHTNSGASPGALRRERGGGYLLRVHEPRRGGPGQEVRDGHPPQDRHGAGVHPRRADLVSDIACPGRVWGSSTVRVQLSRFREWPLDFCGREGCSGLEMKEVN